MEVINTPIEGLLLVRTKVYADERGYFTELYHEKEWADKGIHLRFVQNNQSSSKKGVLRGLHFQRPPFEQAKLIRVVKGCILDVAVDLRKSSPTFGQHYKIELSEDNMLQLFIPGNFAHGFLTLEDETVIQYNNTNYYTPASEGGLQWNDPDLNIDWGIKDPLLSEKDTKNLAFKSFESPFE